MDVRSAMMLCVIIYFYMFGDSGAATLEDQLGVLMLKGKYSGVSQGYNLPNDKGVIGINGDKNIIGFGYHPGIDYHAISVPVYSPVSGLVSSVDRSWGRLSIKIDDKKGYFIFLHLDSIDVISGRINVGQQIGVSGKKKTDDAHLHVELRTRSDKADFYFTSLDKVGDHLSPVDVLGYKQSQFEGRESQDYKKMILGSWYYKDNYGMYHRVDFYDNGTYMWYSYMSIKNLHIWAGWYKHPVPYRFVSPNKIVGYSDTVYNIEEIASDNMRIKSQFYDLVENIDCTRSRPAGDTNEQRALSRVLKNKEKDKFVGVWVTKDNKSRVEFKSDWTGSEQSVVNGRWIISKGQYDTYHDGVDAGFDSGLYSYVSSERLLFTASTQYSVYYYRQR